MSHISRALGVCITLTLSFIISAHAQDGTLKQIKKVTKPKISKKAKVNETPLPPVVGESGLIAKVNSKGILLNRFKEKYDRFTQTFKARKRPVPNRIDARYRDSIVKRLIEEELIAQEATRVKVQVPADKLKEEFDKYKKMFKTDERFQRYLKNARLTEDKVKKNLSGNLRLRALLEHLSGESVNANEARKYYDENQAKYKVREQVRARHILLKTVKNATPAQIAAIKFKADKIAKEAQANPSDEAFAALAKKHSEGPTATRGGDLSFFTRNRMVKEFDAKAFTMKVGEISDPVKTRFGWHIIRVVERKDERMRPFEEVKDSIERTLTNRANRTARQKLIAKLRAKAKVEIFLPEVKLAKSVKSVKSVKSAKSIKAAAKTPVKIKAKPVQK